MIMATLRRTAPTPPTTAPTTGPMLEPLWPWPAGVVSPVEVLVEADETSMLVLPDFETPVSGGGTLLALVMEELGEGVTDSGTRR